jgi:hypothetical protein
MWGKRGAMLQENDRLLDRSILANFTSLLVSNTFSNELVGMLPEEIISEITKHLGPSCLLSIRESGILLNRICSKPPQTNTSLNFAAVVYGSTISFRGNSYISEISNRPDENSGLRKLRGRLRAAECRALISLDEIGVRGIGTFEQEVSSLPADHSPWYRVFQSSPETMFQCVANVSDSLSLMNHLTQNQGLIVRDIYPELVSSPYDLFQWNTPNPPTIKSSNFFSDPSTRVSHSRFKYVPLKDESCMLTVCCRARKLLDIRTHYLAKSPNGCDFEQNPVGKNMVRLCFPLNAGEKIRGLWIRTPKPTSARERAIIVSSNIA